MTSELLHRIVAFILLVAVQGLVLNHIHLLGVATPLLYVYFVMKFRRHHPRWSILLWSFFMGLCIDIFSNTPGVAAASMTLLAFVQPYIVELFVSHDSDDDLLPSMAEMGVPKFVYYTLIMVVLYTLVFFSLEAFNFSNPLQWLLRIGSSTLLTVILILAIENLNRR